MSVDPTAERQGGSAPLTLAAVEAAVRSSFAEAFCAEDDLPVWSPANPSRGHCAVTALVVHDLFGGDLLVARVHQGGEPAGYHWWNRLAGVDIDLTRDQFGPDETVGEPEVVVRPVGRTHRYVEQYEGFRAQVFAALGAAAEAPSR